MERIRSTDALVDQPMLMRVLALMAALCKEGMTISAAAKFLNTSVRSAYRYLHLIETLDVTIDSRAHTESYRIAGNERKVFFITPDNCPFCKNIIHQTKLINELTNQTDSRGASRNPQQTAEAHQSLVRTLERDAKNQDG